MIECYLLGVSQDAGAPQIGCNCEHCVQIKAERLPAQHAVCLAIVHQKHDVWLIDATPDFKAQWQLLETLVPNFVLQGIFLTHIHVGHYLGLASLGKEALNVSRLPVYATKAVCSFLQDNGPWSLLVENGNIVLHGIQPGAFTRLPTGATPQSAPFTVKPVLVPHRAEFSDTCAFEVTCNAETLFYCPDIDSWGEWDQDLSAVVSRCKWALLDATFYSGNELPGRDMAAIPHPLMTDTMARLSNKSGGEVVFIHLNHTNPTYRDTPERKLVSANGFHIGRTGQDFRLGAED